MYQLKPITLTETLIILDITKTESNNNCSIIHCTLYIMLKKRFDHPCHITHEFDIALGNHALHVQPTDYLLIC